MSRHLNSQQISEAVLGERGEVVEAHLRECSTCRGELERLEDGLSMFGSVMRSWGDRESAAARLPRGQYRHRLAFPKLLSAGAAFATVLAVGLFLELHHPRHDRELSKPEVSDAVLMQQVNSELARSVPGPMEPLENLMDAQ